MDVNDFINSVQSNLGIRSFFGVPDSLLRPICDELIDRYGIGSKHLIAADEGGAVALASGRYLATGEPSMVYMQNSGIGNAVNPICSLTNERVYAIPVLFVVGWRGEPGVHDEPQHVFQGECSQRLLETIDVPVRVLDLDTTLDELMQVLSDLGKILEKGRSCALLVRKGAITRSAKRKYSTEGSMSREQAVEVVTKVAPTSTAFVSTTGKLSRELFEIRERLGQSHETDFLTVGSMGHSSMIGLGVAQAQPNRPVVVLDGDGAALMHTGALAIVGSQAPANFVHVLINNEAHDSVGGMPTASASVDWAGVAAACGYGPVCSVDTADDLASVIVDAFTNPCGKPVFIEVRVNLESRADLGRPTTTAYENGKAFMGFLAENE